MVDPLFLNPEKSKGMNLKIATVQVGWDDVAKSFTEVTGKKAVFRDITLEEYFASGAFPFPDAKIGHSADHNDDTLQTYRKNFSGFWNTWEESVLQRHYAVLDEILPSRVKTMKEWMQVVGYTGEHGNVLKDYSDARSKHTAV